MLVTVLTGFLAAALAPLVTRSAGRAAGWILGLAPLGLAVSLLLRARAVISTGPISETFVWVPSLGANLSFYLDGLSLLMALIITGVGALVVVYAGGYLAGHRYLNRFYVVLLSFMASMLGLVLSANAFSMFIFWELTSITSFLLIGFYNEKAASRRAALQALLVTGGGGLALLGGLVLLSNLLGTAEIPLWLGQGELVRSSDLYLPILILVLLGAFTKSAQAPFHFWLPNAMEAPAPVSAYLHSATMVKAGVYLLARLSLVLAGSEAWRWSVGGVGALTMLVGAYLAFKQTDLKRILAYSTVSALGMMVMLLGLDLVIAAEAAMVFLLGHALYKGGLFLAAGNVDHETGSRDIRELGGLRAKMPLSAAATILAALSLAGLPLFLGFMAKELLYEATLDAHFGPAWLPAALTGGAILANGLMAAAAGLVALRPYFGTLKTTPKAPHEAPAAMWLGPVLLAGLGLLFGLLPALPGGLLSSAASGIAAEALKIKLVIWPGFNQLVLLSAVTLLLGAVLYGLTDKARPSLQRLDIGPRFGPARWYDSGLKGLNLTARAITARLQSGRLDVYVLVVVIVGGLAIAYPLLWPWNGLPAVQFAPLSKVLTETRPHEWLVAALILGGALSATQARSRLVAVISLGVVGLGVSLLYVLFSAPDLAMTQLAIEILTVILFVLVIYRLPPLRRYSGRKERLLDMAVALLAGAMMTLLTLAVVARPLVSRLAPYFAENSLEKAKGLNIVNVILVDFRGIDTLGEITVLAVAALGVYTLLKLHLQQGDDD